MYYPVPVPWQVNKYLDNGKIIVISAGTTGYWELNNEYDLKVQSLILWSVYWNQANSVGITISMWSHVHCEVLPNEFWSI